MFSAERTGRMIPNLSRTLSGLMIVGMALLLEPVPAGGAAISWDEPITVIAPTDISFPAGATVHFAADFNTATDFGPEDDMINGILFTQVGAGGIAGRLAHTFTDGPNFGAATFPGGTGDSDLDNLLNSHSWDAGDPQTASVTIQGLTVGAPYQIQVIGAVDTRACCATRVYQPDDGQGTFSATATIARGLTQSILGTFTADAATQSFQWRSLNNAAGNNDPAMSGLVVTRLPGTGGVVSATLNRETGNLNIQNGTTQPLDMIGYSVISNFGGLNPGNLQSVANNFDKPSAPTPGNGSIDADDAWQLLSGPASRNNISEAELNVSGTRNGGAIAPGQTLNLGNVWIKSPTEDVVVEVLRTDGRIHNVGLTFTGNDDQAYRFADLDFDNALTPADWSAYLAGALTNVSALSGAERYQKGDLNNDGVNNLNDMKLFLDAYDAANGAGAFQAMLTSQTVPEPSAGLLLLSGAIGLVFHRAKSRRSMTAVVAFVAAGLVAVGTAPQPAEAAPITWGQPFPVESPADIIALPGGTVNFAVDFNTPDGFGTEPVIINGIEFTQVDAAGIPGMLTHSFSSGPNFGAAAFPGGTGNIGLDNLLNSHSWHAGNPVTAFVTLEGLTIGAAYQIQVIGAGDTRDCCAARAYEPDDGMGNFNTGISYTRGDIASIVGTFTADADTQTFQWRSLNDEVNNNDPSMSGLVLTQGAATGPITLDLQVNSLTGFVTLRNDTAGAFQIRGYEVTSAGGSLNPGGWTVPPDWQKALGASANALLAGTLAPDDVAMLATGATLPLGQAFSTAVNAQDLEFRFLTGEGLLRPGTVSYVMTPPAGIAGDYNGNGFVDAADYVAWRNALNTPTTLPNDSTPGTVVQADYEVWRTNFGRVGSGAALGEAAAVPEPGTAMLVLILALGLFGHRRFFGRNFALRRDSVVVAFAAALVGLGVSEAVHANAWVDRTYRFGDDPAENAANAPGGIVGSGPNNPLPGGTLDSADSPGAGDLQDLLQFGSPTYIDVSTTSANLSQARPGAAAGSRGIRFDGVDDYLQGARLNFPQTSDASTASIVQPPGPLDYVGLSDRGFQLWVYPTGPNPARVQSVVSDLNQHGLRINAAGNWVMRYNGADVDSNRPVSFNQWSHLMVVRPFGTAAPNGGSILYLNGEAIAAAPGGYNTVPTPNDYLVVGAEPADANLVVDAEFFQGVLDDMNTIVMGTVTNGPNPAPGTYGFNFGDDNTFASMPAAVSGLSGVNGDVNQDSVVNGLDIDALVAGWFKEKRVNNVRAGDKLTIRDGDLNFDGITNLADVYLLHNALVAGTGSGFDFSRLPGGVPEPSTLVLAISLFALSLSRTGRRQSAIGLSFCTGEKSHAKAPRR